MNIIEYLITELQCDPTVRDNDSLPLHFSCQHGHLNITKYFITEQNCDPTSFNNHRKTHFIMHMKMVTSKSSNTLLLNVKIVMIILIG